MNAEIVPQSAQSFAQVLLEVRVSGRYSHQPDGYECPFCRIANGQDCEANWAKQTDVVWRDEMVTAFINSAFWPDNPDPKVKQFVDEYRRRANVVPGNTDALIYDTLHILKMCIEKTGVTNKPADLGADRERIRGCWADLKDYPGVVGRTTMNADGDAVLVPTVLQARGGRWDYMK